MGGALDAWSAQALGDREELRRVPLESLHVTLCFLGSRPEEEVEEIAAAALACAAPVPELRAAPPAWLPPRQPRVLAVDLEDVDGACGRLQACVSEALAALGAYEPERRAFRPHVTVARVRKGQRARRSLLEPPAIPPFPGHALTLFASRLSPGGARYEALARATLNHV